MERYKRIFKEFGPGTNPRFGSTPRKKGNNKLELINIIDGFGMDNPRSKLADSIEDLLDDYVTWEEFFEEENSSYGEILKFLEFRFKKEFPREYLQYEQEYK